MAWTNGIVRGQDDGSILAGGEWEEPMGTTSVDYAWRGAFTSDEVNRLHAEAFQHRLYTEAEWNWEHLTRVSLGWVTARRGPGLSGFVNVPWDGAVHAFILDVMVAPSMRRQGIATRLVALAREKAREAGCEWLHVDFEEHLSGFYFEACGFRPTPAGVIRLGAG